MIVDGVCGGGGAVAGAGGDARRQSQSEHEKLLEEYCSAAVGQQRPLKRLLCLPFLLPSAGTAERARRKWRTAKMS